jgi:hypothetical protein
VVLGCSAEMMGRNAVIVTNGFKIVVGNVCFCVGDGVSHGLSCVWSRLFAATQQCSLTMNPL